MRGEPYLFKINKYLFLGARTSYGATVVAYVVSVSFCEGICTILIFRLGDFLGKVLHVSTSSSFFKYNPNGSVGPLTSVA